MPKNKKDPEAEEFLRELTLLTHKYGIGIGGCGCCSSPYLLTLDKSDTGKKYILRNDSIQFNQEK